LPFHAVLNGKTLIDLRDEAENPINLLNIFSGEIEDRNTANFDDPAEQSGL